MRRVNIKNGLKQRLNEIFGTDYGTEGNVKGITPWSVQSAMMANIRRTNKGIVGDAIGFGRVVNGLILTKPASGLYINVGSGLAVTPNGDIIVVESELKVTVPGNTTTYIYLKHILDTLDGDIYPEGKKTGFVSNGTPENIVYDDLAASKGNQVNEVVDSIIIRSPTDALPEPDPDDCVYLGKVITSSGSVTSVESTSVRGIATGLDSVFENIVVKDSLTADVGTFLSTLDARTAIATIKTLIVQLNAAIGGSLTCTGTVSGSGFSAAGNVGVSGIADTTGSAKKLSFNGGICIGWST